MSQPTLPMIILGRNILKLRRAAGLSQAQLAKRCRVSEAKISNMENGKHRISLFDIAGLCRVLNASPELTRQLERMSGEAEGPGWWEPYTTYMLRDFSMCLELEAICARLDIYESELITGLLQTREYAAAVNAVVPSFDAEQIAEAGDLQAKRQEVFWSRDPMPEVRIVLHESAVSRSICGAEGDSEQRQHLLDVASRANVDMRVLPSNGAHPSMKGSYMILGSGVPEIADTVYTETVTGARYEATQDAVTQARRFFEATLAHAVPVKEYSHEAQLLAQST
ncbi:helix-turn-helix domain-containing protein [Stackebrandtia albiflava]